MSLKGPWSSLLRCITTETWDPTTLYHHCSRDTPVHVIVVPGSLPPCVEIETKSHVPLPVVTELKGLSVPWSCRVWGFPNRRRSLSPTTLTGSHPTVSSRFRDKGNLVPWCNRVHGPPYRRDDPVPGPKEIIDPSYPIYRRDDTSSRSRNPSLHDPLPRRDDPGPRSRVSDPTTPRDTKETSDLSPGTPNLVYGWDDPIPKHRDSSTHDVVESVVPRTGEVIRLRV